MSSAWSWSAAGSRCIVGAAATAVAMGVGGLVGVLSGYFGGWVDMLLMRITDYFLVVPDLVLMIVVATLWGPSLSHVILVIGLLLWTSTARIVRAEVKSVRERVYVRRARTMGAGHTSTVFRHVLPQIAPLLIANTVLSVAIAIFDETSLDFLGLGDPNGTSWGVILEHANDRTAVSYGAWWTVVPAGHLHRGRHRRLLPARPGARGRAQPAAADLPLRVPQLAAAAAGRPGSGRAVTSLLEVADLRGLLRPARRRAARSPGRRPRRSRPASGSPSSASRGPARRRRSSR